MVGEIMEKMLEKQIKGLSKRIPCVGFSVVLFDNEKVLYKHNQGYINKEKAIQTDDDSMFMIGSNTKVITSLCIFKLYEEGKLLLEDDIKKYIPELNIKSLFEYEKITIGDILMHRAGLQCDLYNFIMNDSKDYHEIVEALGDTYLTNKPGQMFAYSNIGYTLLGIVIERISGLSYVDFVNEYIAKPLNIEISFKHSKNQLPDNYSLCYNKKLQSVIDLVDVMIPAGSNTYMKILDFVKIGQLLLNEGSVDGNVIFQKETIELMKTYKLTHELDDQMSNVGYGIFHNKEQYGNAGKVYGHGGDTVCHHSFFSFIPDQNLGALVFTNTETATMLSRMLGISALSIYLGNQGFDVPKVLKKEYQYVNTDISNYVGEYATVLGLMELKYDKKNNLVTNIKGLPVKLLPCDDGFLHAVLNCNFILKGILKKVMPTLRLKLVDYYGEEVLLLEQITVNQVAKVIIGTRHIENANTDTLWYQAVGEYEITNMNTDKISLKLVEQNGKLLIQLDLDSEKTFSYLMVENDNLAFTQGFGRNAKEACHLRVEDGYYYLTCQGVIGKKKA